MSNDPDSPIAQTHETDDREAVAEESGIDPQAAAELSQEIGLLTRALFAQLLPATAANAVSGVVEPEGPQFVAPPSPTDQVPADRPGLETSRPMTTPAPTLQVPPEPAADGVAAVIPLPVQPPALPVPDVDPSPAAATTESAPAAPAPAPLAGLPVPALSVEDDTTADDASEPARIRRPRSLAVLEEIAFLDE